MKASSSLALLAILSVSAAFSAFAGHEIVEPTEPLSKLEVARTLLPDDPPGLLTVAVQFSEHSVGGYVDSITGLWTTPQRDAFLFLDSLYHYVDDGQFVNSTGLAFRKLFSDADVIIGGNVFWDAISSEFGNDYNQFGVGVELMTHWVDFRFNYYLPDDDTFEIERRSRNYKRYEAALEGFDTEIGVLLPDFGSNIEARLFGGFYRYEHPFRGGFEGFKARLEARPLPGLILDVEYWDDAVLTGGHWTAGVRVSVPFSLYNVIKLRNPFEGSSEMFKRRPRDFDERIAEMIIRSQRIKTATSDRF